MIPEHSLHSAAAASKYHALLASVHRSHIWHHTPLVPCLQVELSATLYEIAVLTPPTHVSGMGHPVTSVDADDGRQELAFTLTVRVLVPSPEHVAPVGQEAQHGGSAQLPSSKKPSSHKQLPRPLLPARLVVE